jgi:hypothetical protein
MLAVLAGSLAGCDAPTGAGGGDGPSAGSPANDANTFRASVDPDRAYAGQWALASSHCTDDKKIWTVEPRRMAIQKQRFCLFEDIYASQGKGDAPTTWSTGAKCLAEGHESHDFVFFRVKDNLREMRVTFNDADPVDLVRCPQKS